MEKVLAYLFLSVDSVSEKNSDLDFFKTFKFVSVTRLLDIT